MKQALRVLMIHRYGYASRGDAFGNERSEASRAPARSLQALVRHRGEQ
ncbi:hypothetical protein [Streptomyces sp. st77]|nr:hypothetical protein [Streptomyces sp. st77]